MVSCTDDDRSAIKLVELGPRLTLELFKVERGFHEGDVLYHKYGKSLRRDCVSRAK